MNPIQTIEQANEFLSHIFEEITDPLEAIAAILTHLDELFNNDSFKSCEVICAAGSSWLEHHFPTVRHYDFFQGNLLLHRATSILHFMQMNPQVIVEAGTLARTGISHMRKAIANEFEDDDFYTLASCQTQLVDLIGLAVQYSIDLSQTETKALLDEAMELVSTNLDADFAYGIIQTYVKYHMSYEGFSPRLEKLLWKLYHSMKDRHGVDSIQAHIAERELVVYLLDTHQFSRAIPHAKRIVDRSYVFSSKVFDYQFLMFVLWGAKDVKEAICACKKAYKLAKKEGSKQFMARLKKVEKSIRKKKKMPI